MNTEYIKEARQRLLNIKRTLNDKKFDRKFYATTASICSAATLITTSVSTGKYYIPASLALTSLINGIRCYISHRRVNESIANFYNLKDEYNSQKKLTNKANQ